MLNLFMPRGLVAALVAFTLTFGGSLAFGQTSQSPSHPLELGDLGIQQPTPEANFELQKTLNERRVMLHQHQIWGIIALGLIGGALLTGDEGKASPQHVALGASTAAIYAVSAYNAIAAPVLPGGLKPMGGSLWHRRLAWVHVPGMVVTPILGYLAAKQVERGEKVSGVNELHQSFAVATAATLALSVVLVSFEF